MLSLLVATALLRKEHVFLSKDADPTCKTGIVSADLYACCPKSCASATADCHRRPSFLPVISRNPY